MLLAHQRFVSEYMKDLDGNAAAIRSGYTEASARFQASKILSRPEVKEEIQRRLTIIANDAGVKAVDVLRELRRVMMVDPGEFYDPNGHIMEMRNIPEDARRAISSFEEEAIFGGVGQERTQIGVLRKFKLFDKVRGAEFLGKYFKLYTDKVEVNDNTDRAIRLKKAREKARDAK